MVVTSLRTEGLSPRVVHANLGRTVALARGPAGRVVADALEIWSGTLCAERLPDVLVALGAASAPDAVEVIVEDGVVVGASWDRRGALVGLLAEGERRLGVEATVGLDPTLFANLREQAIRDPRLVGALGASLVLRVKVGWLLTHDGLGATIGLLGLAVGGAEFPVTGSERAAWAPAVLREVGRRVARVRWQDDASAVSARLLDAGTGPDPERRARYRRAADALARPPFRLGRFEPIDLGDTVVGAFGEDLVRIDRLGPAALHALQLVEAVLVDQPDVLIVDGPGAGFDRPSSIARWLGRAVQGDRATLEQVFLVPGGGR